MPIFKKYCINVKIWYNCFWGDMMRKSVKERMIKAENAIISYMNLVKINEITALDCEKTLIECGIYRKNYRDRAEYFTNDLLYISETKNLDLLKHIDIMKIDRRWIIKKK